MDSLEDLTAEIRAFAHERNWAKFHTPKNLAMAVARGAGELVAEFQWLSDDEIASEKPFSSQQTLLPWAR